jgi:hypothetical protein
MKSILHGTTGPGNIVDSGGIVTPTVRESRRTRKVQLRISAREGLEIVVPQGFDRSLLPGILESHRDWIRRMQGRVEKERRQLPAGFFQPLPETVSLQAIGRTYEVIYRESKARRFRVRSFPERVLVEGPERDTERLRAALRGWLHTMAGAHLRDWLAQTGKETGLRYGTCRIRNQKTRWGSCSRDGNINLNCKLLFLTEELVRYVLVHELCHTRQMNHSPAFWALVERRVPGSRRLDRELRAAWRMVPQWAER